MKKKGFATTATLYTTLLIFLVLMIGILNNLQNKKTVLDQLKVETVYALSQSTIIDSLLEKVEVIELNIAEINTIIGDTDISDIADGTLTGAIRMMNDTGSSSGGSGLSQEQSDQLEALYNKLVGDSTITDMSFGAGLQGYAAVGLSRGSYTKIGVTLLTSGTSGVVISGGDSGPNAAMNGTNVWGATIGTVTSVNTEAVFDISKYEYINVENIAYESTSVKFRLFNE